MPRNYHARVLDDFAASAVRVGAHSRPLDSGAGRDGIAAIIVAGGYPGAPDSDRLRVPWFEGYLERMLRVDATDIRRGASSERLDALVRLIAANQSGELVKACLARARSPTQGSRRHWCAALRRCDRFVGGIVLGLGEKSLPFGPTLYSLPVSSLWELVP